MKAEKDDHENLAADHSEPLTDTNEEKTPKDRADKNKKGRADLLQGNISLKVMAPLDQAKLRMFEEQLGQISELRVVLISGSADGAVEVIVAADKPLPVIDVLNGLPVVADVVNKGKQIQIALIAEEATGGD